MLNGKRVKHSFWTSKLITIVMVFNKILCFIIIDNKCKKTITDEAVSDCFESVCKNQNSR